MIRYLYCRLTKQAFEFNEGSGMMDAGIDFVVIGIPVMLMLYLIG